MHAATLTKGTIGPEHSYIRDISRAQYDNEAVDAFMELTRIEGVIPAIESAHAIAHAIKLTKSLCEEKITISLSGGGDKDIVRTAKLQGIAINEEEL